jgi:hypothetical protein
MYNGNPSNAGCGLYIDGDYLKILLGGVSLVYPTTPVSLTGSWTHVAAVRNSGTWSLYVNGVSQGTLYSDMGNYNPNAPAGDFMVGGKGGVEGFNGLIDEVRFTDGVRYTGNFTPPSAPFTTDGSTIALYHFDEGTGSTTADASTNHFNLTLVNSPTWLIDENPIPVELISFTAKVSNLNATLTWKTATEVNNYGFEIEKRTVSSQLSSVNSWVKIGFVRGNGTSNSPKEYSYTDASVASGAYAYRLKQIDNCGAFKYSQEAEVTVVVPKVFALSQNYPNPFNPSTMISFDLPTKSFVSLKIFDLLGREVATIVSEEMSTGSHVKQWNAENCPSGVYFYRLQAGSLTETKRMILMK